MNAQTDQQLLQDYVERRIEPAFGELVRRHVNLVYSMALRIVRDGHLAEDVTQAVFMALAQNARQVAGRAVLSGWLHRTAQNLAANAVRTDVRRRAREEEAAVMNEMLSTGSEADWEHLAPHLDSALSELSEAERDAVLMRYFEGKSARAMAHLLGTTEEAAQKRAARAVEHLRDIFAKRRVEISATGLVMIISANAVQPAPAALAATISIAVAGAARGTTAIATATKATAMTTLQKTVLTSTIVAGLGIGIFQARHSAQLREKVQTLEQQQAPLTEQVNGLTQGFSDATNQLLALTEENANLRTNAAEVIRLRAQLARQGLVLARALTRQGQGVSSNLGTDLGPVPQGMLEKINLLKQWFEKTPAAKIPELQYMGDRDWLRVGQSLPELETEENFRRAASAARQAAKAAFGGRIAAALGTYARTNGGQLPTDVLQLKPYLDAQTDPATFNSGPPQEYAPVSAACLPRYQMTLSGPVTEVQTNQTVVVEKAPVDDQFDTLFKISLEGYTADGTGKNNVHSSGYRGSPGSPQIREQQRRGDEMASEGAKRMLATRLEILKSTLTADQLEAYRQKKLEELDRADEAAALLRSFQQ